MVGRNEVDKSLLEVNISNTQMDWSLVMWIDRYQSYFWPKISATVILDFKLPDHDSFLDLSLFRKIGWTWNFK